MTKSGSPGQKAYTNRHHLSPATAQALDAILWELFKKREKEKEGVKEYESKVKPQRGSLQCARENFKRQREREREIVS